jgi:hypothetical protein
MSEIGEECSLCGRQCDPGILLDRVCPWCYKPAPPASDDVREILEECEVEEAVIRIAALISAHVAKQTAALTAQVQALTPGGSEFQTFDECIAWIKGRLDTRAQMVAEHKREITALTAKVERMMGAIETAPNP